MRRHDLAASRDPVQCRFIENHVEARRVFSPEDTLPGELRLDLQFHLVRAEPGDGAFMTGARVVRG
ncbi:MAG TPA: hypothetical protein VFN75_00600, partial [Pseudonocardiaceae bacterium]|nr:hypothetical protein [Pseudonocardiaceae bacterium]